MLTRSYPLKIDLTGTQFQDYNKQRLIFFDIETTGLQARMGFIYLIGAIYCDEDGWTLTQWLADGPDDELNLIQAFFDKARNRSMLVSFNGERFDLPFINEKCRHYHIHSSLSMLNSRDLYRMLHPFKALFALESMKQKSLEEYAGFKRKDIFDGKQLIPVYETYSATKDEQSMELLFQHNADDLFGLTCLVPLLNYQSIFTNNFVIINYEVEGDNFNILGRLPCMLPKKFRYDAGMMIIYGEEDFVLFSIAGKRDSLKYFYKDYKNYYYLPQEDTAIHKSVAQYVDKAYREPATARTCYQKKAGYYLPQNDEVFKPVFRTDYSDKQLYFPCNEKWLAEGENVAVYISHLLTEK